MAGRSTNLRPTLSRARVAAISAAIASLAAPAVLTQGCGASYQSIHEGEVRFEHCYRLDLDADVSLNYRRECWVEWTKFYTYGQTRDRIEFALRRARELSAQLGDDDAGAPATEAGTEPSTPHLTPSPTSRFEPPPAVVAAPLRDAGGDGAPSATSSSAASKSNAVPLDGCEIDPLDGPPGQNCILMCGKSWRSCVDRCEEKGRQQCRTTCGIRFRTCTARCL